MAFKPGCSECGSFAINHQCHGRDGSDGHLCDVCYWRKRAEVKQANATLIAAAPELLAALEAVIEWYDMEADHSIEPDFYKRMASCQVSEDMAREAIAKAKGGKA